MNPEMETRSLTSSSVGLVTEGSGKRGKSFKRRVWASTIAALLAVGLSACDADSLKNAMGGRRKFFNINFAGRKCRAVSGG